MQRAFSYILEIVVIVVVLAMTAPFTFETFDYLTKEGFGGFGTQIEKTAMATTGEIIPQKRNTTRDDIMLMFAIADQYAPEPRFFDINGTVLHIDDTYLANRTLGLIAAFNAMPDNSSKKITLYVGPSGPRFWKIENE